MHGLKGDRQSGVVLVSRVLHPPFDADRGRGSRRGRIGRLSSLMSPNIYDLAGDAHVVQHIHDSDDCTPIPFLLMACCGGGGVSEEVAGELVQQVNNRMTSADKGEKERGLSGGRWACCHGSCGESGERR